MCVCVNGADLCGSWCLDQRSSVWDRVPGSAALPRLSDLWPPLPAQPVVLFRSASRPQALLLSELLKMRPQKVRRRTPAPGLCVARSGRRGMVWGAPARTLEDNTTGERAGGELVAWGWGVWLAHRVANSFVDVFVGLLFKWRSCVSTTGDGSGCVWFKTGGTDPIRSVVVSFEPE